MSLFADFRIEDVGCSILFTRVISVLKDSNALEILRNSFRGGLATLRKDALIPVSSAHPAVYAVQDDQTTIVLLDGISLASHAAGIWTGWVNPGDHVKLNVVNSWAKDGADTVLLEMGVRGLNKTRKSIVVGWSGGGMIAPCLALAMRETGWPGEISIITFGSPRVGGVNYARRLAEYPAVRWMTCKDPVPHLPLRVSDRIGVVSVYTPEGLQNIGDFCHFHGGVSLTETGKMVKADTSTEPVLVQVGNLMTWMTNGDKTTNNPHSMASYALALEALEGTLRTRWVPELPMSATEATERRRKKEYSVLERSVAQSMFYRGDLQNPAQVVAPRERQFRAFRQGRLWLVSFGDEVIAFAPSKKRAQGLARVGNNLLERLQRQAAVDQEGLSQQFTRYLADAVEPGSGWDPPINDEWPE